MTTAPATPGPAPLTFHDAAARFAEGGDSPSAYLDRCLAAIAAREGVVRAFVTVNEPGAREAAAASTARWRAGRPLSPIDGMPIGIKDLIETRDMPTEMGSPLFRGNHPRRDSASVRALREAGAVILGKTVTTEFGMSHPGPTTNPFDAKRTPGGSSSGSAAAVGANFVPAAIGTQVVGSIIRPASFCANRAIKPTFGALNRGERQGLSQSCAGVHANSLADMWAVAWEIARRAGGDPGHPGLSGSPALDAPRRPARLAVLETEGWPQVDAATREAFAQALRAVEAAGVALIRRADHPLVEALEQAIADSMALSRDLCAYEMRWSMENLLDQHPDGLSESMMGRVALGRRITPEDYRTCLQRRAEARARLADLAGLVDGFIAPAATGPAPLSGQDIGADRDIPHTTGNPAMNSGTSVLGAPCITVPVMTVGGLPVGVQVMGQWHQDAAVAGLARWLEAALPRIEVA
jgi:Asp-tRNA(Asn)/Glu-tRNA(Gln) amidotransferase A subunit family amidase